MNETIETEAVSIREQQPQSSVSLFRTDDPGEIVTRATNVATSLKAVIEKQGLISKISGKEYPRCEAWTLLGTMLGVFPVCLWSRQVENGWEARVEAKTRDGAIVGAAEAQCLRSEKNWNNRDDFALRSMAQTRATAKCLRMPLGFVMTLAGYEATPAEEMTHEPERPQHQYRPPQPQSQPPAPKPAPAVKSPTETTRTWFLEQLGDERERVHLWLIEVGWIMPNEGIEDLPLRYVPNSKTQLADLLFAATELAMAGNVVKPYEANGVPEGAKAPESQSGEEDAANEPWRAFQMPFGKEKGVPLGELPKNKLFGWWANYKVETEYNGKPKNPDTIAKDQAFRDMLDEAGKHYEFTKKD
jgi:hypothetical protein